MSLYPPLPAWNECRIWGIGASTGTGATTAQALLAAGARVALSARIVAFFEQLVPADAERIGALYAPDASFRDPFNDVHGVAEISRVFRHMFDELSDYRFVIGPVMRFLQRKLG